MKRVCLMILKCSAEPKHRYLAQNSYFDIKIEPLWLNDEICPNGKWSGFWYRVAEKFAEITVFEIRLLLCPVGYVSLYNKQGTSTASSQSAAFDGCSL